MIPRGVILDPFWPSWSQARAAGLFQRSDLELRMVQDGRRAYVALGVEVSIVHKQRWLNYYCAAGVSRCSPGDAGGN